MQLENNEDDFIEQLKRIKFKSPDWFDKPIHQQIAIQVARTVRKTPEMKIMIVYTFDKNRVPQVQKFPVEII